MASDITKDNFDPQMHYASVRMQQGRVLSDDDWNENERIENEERRRTQVDVIGPFGSPDEGFKIETNNPTNPANPASQWSEFTIKMGTLYLGGLRLDMDVNEPLNNQADWLQINLLESTYFPLPSPRFDLVYIEAWQQTVTAVEDEGLLEVALGGPDTTTRVRNMRRVKILQNITPGTCGTGWTTLKGQLGNINDEHELRSGAKLKVVFEATGLSDDLCSPSAVGGYLGAQNQTIRIKLTGQNASGQNTFTWGFDNASTLFKAELELNNTSFKLITDPKDEHHRLKISQIVEIIPHSARLANGQEIAELNGTLRKITLIKDDIYTFDQAITGTFRQSLYIRIWDRGEDLTSPAEIIIPPINAVTPAVDLGKTGLKVTISDINTEVLNPKDDFWIISVRPETPNRVIPWAAIPTGIANNTTGISPNGVRRFYAPLAVIQWTGSPSGSISGRVIHDCRKPFLPLTENRDHCELIPPGRDTIQLVIDKYNDLQQDICLCFQNGEYLLSSTVLIKDKGHIKFTGCGKGSKIIIENAEAAFSFVGCKDITIRDLSVESRSSEHVLRKQTSPNNPPTIAGLRGGITVTGCKDILFENILVTSKDRGDWQFRESSCINIKDNESSISIRNSEFRIGYQQTGILIVNPIKAHIENNRLLCISNSEVAVDNPIANQGIVVAGKHAIEVHIKDNTLLDVQQGIHIGTSNTYEPNASRSTTTFKSTSLIISGNMIDCVLNNGMNRERHGIFVGNCNSLILRDNHIKLKRNITNPNQSSPPMNGIRIYGHFGKRIIIRDNFLEGFDYNLTFAVAGQKKNIGIYIVYLSNVSGRKWWIVEANVTEALRIEGAGRPFRTAKMIYADRWREL